MQGLVLEGGSFRGIFSAGVLDALLEDELMFPYCIGVSAGISNGVSYISKQPRRNLDILVKYRGDKRYVGRRNFFKCGSIFGLDFVYNQIPNQLVPFDYSTFFNYEGTCLIGVTHAKTGTVRYFDSIDMDKKFTLLQASCALPVFFPAIKIADEYYYDGGLCAPICIDKAREDGCDRFLIVLTQPKGYVKKVGKFDRMGARLVGFKYPKVKERILNRYKDYNRQVKDCEQLEKEGKAIILRPEYPLNSFESSVEELKKTYQHGYDMAKDQLERIRVCLGFEE